MRHGARWAAVGVGAITAGVMFAAAAWACVAGPSVFTSTITAKPGDVVGVKGVFFSRPEPVMVRFNALDGPVLTDLGPPKNRTVEGTITVPPDTKPGNYVLVFTQTGADGKYTQTPIRAMLTVTGAGGEQPLVGAPVGVAAEPRAEGIVTEDESVSGGALALVALGVGGIGMFLAGIAALVASRRGTAAAAAKARS